MAHVESKGIMAYRSLWMAYLGEAYLHAGRAEEAGRIAVQALDLARGHRERGHEARVLRLLGDLAAPRDVDAARAAYAEALTRARSLDMRPLAAQCRLAVAAVERRAGRLDIAHGELDAAIADFRSMDMPFWLSRAEAELARAPSC